MTINFDTYINEQIWGGKNDPKIRGINKNDNDKADDDIGEWLLKKIIKDGVDEARLQKTHDAIIGNFTEIWNYTILRGKQPIPPAEDPYAEEDWGDQNPDNKNIRIRIYRRITQTGSRYTVSINNNNVEISDKILGEITKLLDEPEKRRAKEALERAEKEKLEKRKALRKFLFEEKYKFKKTFEQFVSTSTWDVSDIKDDESDVVEPIKNEKPDDIFAKKIIELLEEDLKYNVMTIKNVFRTVRDFSEKTNIVIYLSYTIIRKPKILTSIDPYDEENWDEGSQKTKRIEVIAAYNEVNNDSAIIINSVTLDISENFAEKIIKLLNQPKKDEEKRCEEMMKKMKENDREKLRKQLFEGNRIEDFFLNRTEFNSTEPLIDKYIIDPNLKYNIIYYHTPEHDIIKRIKERTNLRSTAEFNQLIRRALFQIQPSKRVKLKKDKKYNFQFVNHGFNVIFTFFVGKFRPVVKVITVMGKTNFDPDVTIFRIND